jgi:CRISPR-associated endoribonuclease Cas6
MNLLINYSKISVKTDVKLPYKFIGSTIRGAIGWQLKKVVCINPTKECNGCFAKSDCLFYDMYEQNNLKYRLYINLDGEIKFEIYLFEGLKQKSPYLIATLYKLFKEVGITKNRIKAKFLEIKLNNEIVYNEEFNEFENKFLTFISQGYSKNIHLNIKTPIRIKENGKFVKNNLKLETILRSIWHRYHKLKNSEITPLPFIPEYKIKNQNLHFLDFMRNSNRQKTKMKLGGLIGSMDLEVDDNSYKLLKLGEIIGVGKQVTFGLGNIKIYNE